jgi:hypothetical protein
VLGDVLVELRRITRSTLFLEVRVLRDVWWAAPTLSVRSAVADMRRRRASGSQRVERSAIPRDPLRVHSESALMDVVEGAGWRECARLEVVTSKWPLRPEPLLFMALEGR